MISLWIEQALAALVLAALLCGLCGPLLQGPRRAVPLLLVLVLVAGLLGVVAGLWWSLWLPGFSISSALLAFWWWQQQGVGKRLIAPGQWRFMLWMLLALGGTLYLGDRLWPGLDFYGLGFGSFPLSTGLLLLGLAVWVCRLYWTCLLLVVVQGAFAAGLLGSDNLWDYLLDPWLLLAIALWMLTALAGRGRRPAPPAAQ